MNPSKTITAFLFGAGWSSSIMAMIFIDDIFVLSTVVTNIVLVFLIVQWIHAHWND